MSITTVNEAQAVYTLLQYVLPYLDRMAARHPSSEEAKQAAVILANAAHNKFHAGPMGHQVEAAWNCSYLIQAMEAQHK